MTKSRKRSRKLPVEKLPCVILVIATTFLVWTCHNTIGVGILSTQAGGMDQSIAEHHKDDRGRDDDQSTQLEGIKDGVGSASSRTDVIPTSQSPYGGAFVHLGKSGGSTISVLLKNGCHSFRPHPCRNVTHETIASKLIESYYHVPDFGLLPQSQHDFYLVSTRDPLDRVISAFVYEHYWNRQARNEKMDPKKKTKFQLAYSCFPTLEQFVSYLDDPDDPSKFKYPYPRQEVHAESCQDLARAALYGKVRIYGHLYFGYQRIRSLLPESSVIYATRQEHLQQDWEAVNKLLAASTSSHAASMTVDALPHQRAIPESQMKLPVKRTITKKGTRALCRALQSEYQSYVWFLKQAKNLTPDQVAESIQYACNKCPQLTPILRKWQERPVTEL